MKISVVTPTRGREDRLRRLLARFKAQTWPDRELLILDDSDAPSPFFTALRDPQVRYLHQRERRTLGDKRNQLCELAQGELVAHFDDDDLYSPRYLESVTSLLGASDFFTFSAWYSWHEQQRCFYYWDTARIDPVHFKVARAIEGVLERPPSSEPDAPDIEPNLWGYGFSYLYRRAAWERVRFPSVDFAEDIAFARKLHAAGHSRTTAPDTEGLVLHVLHGQNSSRIFPQYRLPAFHADRLFGPWLNKLL